MEIITPMLITLPLLLTISYNLVTSHHSGLIQCSSGTAKDHIITQYSVGPQEILQKKIRNSKSCRQPYTPLPRKNHRIQIPINQSKSGRGFDESEYPDLNYKAGREQGLMVSLIKTFNFVSKGERHSIFRQKCKNTLDLVIKWAKKIKYNA